MLKYYIRKVKCSDSRRSSLILIRKILDEYYGIEQIEQDRIYIIGDGSFPEVNFYINGILRQIFKSIDNGFDTKMTDEYFSDHGLDIEDDDDIDKVGREIVQESINNFLYLPRTLNNREINTMIHMTNEYYSKRGITSLNYEEVGNIVETVLPIIYGEPFESRTIYGKYKGEEAKCVYPKRSVSKIPWIESLYFVNGTEVVFVDKTFESEEDYEEFIDSGKANKIFWLEYTIYTDNKDIKAWAAKILHCLPTQVEIVE